MKSLGTYALYITAALLVAAVTLLSVIAADAQDTIVLITPTVATTPTAEPVVDMSPIGLLNPSPGEMPVITDALNIDPTRKHGYIITDFSPIYVREGDDAFFRPVAIAEGGVLLDATGVNAQQTWWRVRTTNGEFEGWINAELLILRGDLTDVPVIDRSDMGARLTATFVTFAPQPIFALPEDDDTNVICTILPDEDAAVGRDRSGEFVQIIATCEDGRSVIGFVREEAGGLRNVTQAGLPVATGVPLPMATATVSETEATAAEPSEVVSQPILGANLLTFQEQTVYFQPDVRPANVVCQVPADSYPIIARNNGTSFYLISANCVDGTAVDAWISADAGAFQSDDGDSVPLAVTPQPTPVVGVPEQAARFVTFLPQPLGATPNGDTICVLPPGEYEILARTPRATHYFVVAACDDATVTQGWLPIDTGAFRNPFDEIVPIREP